MRIDRLPPSGACFSPASPQAFVPAEADRVPPLPRGLPIAPAPALAMPAAPRMTAFRHVHHWHTIPGPSSLIGWDDPSKTGDHYAISRYASAFSLQFVHLAKLIGLTAGHIALGTVAGLLWGLGVRQGIHSMMLTTRALRAIRAEARVIDGKKAAFGRDTPVYLRALARRNNHVQWSMRYGLVLDASATFGCLGLGVGTLFRVPLLGEFAPALVHAAIPVLTAFFFPLVAPSVIATIERSARAALTVRKTHVMAHHIENVADPRACQVQALYKQRQRELRQYFALDALARGSFVAGATVSVFVGPGGLLLLVPAALAVIASECLARRVLNVDDTFPLKERLKMRTDADYCTAILKAEKNKKSVQSLRYARAKRYPFGWGTAFRPLVRPWRKHRGEAHGSAQTSGEVLAAFDRRETTVVPCPVPSPQRMMDIIDEGRVRRHFAEAILNDKVLRAALQGHGVTMQGRKWSVDADMLAMHMLETRWNHLWPQKTVDKLYQLAEETLLTHGRVELWRRWRALLDYYGRFAHASLRAKKRGQRAATQRIDS